MQDLICNIRLSRLFVYLVSYLHSNIIELSVDGVMSLRFLWRI